MIYILVCFRIQWNTACTSQVKQTVRKDQGTVLFLTEVRWENGAIHLVLDTLKPHLANLQYQDILLPGALAAITCNLGCCRCIKNEKIMWNKRD